MLRRMMMVLLAFAAVCVSSHAKADPVITFQLSGIFDDGAALSGSVIIDTGTGTIKGGTLTASAPVNLSFDGIWYIGPDYAVPNSTSIFFGTPASTAYITLPTDTLVGYNGSSLDNSYLSAIPGYTSLVSGELTLVPEPSSASAMLVGLGVLAIASFGGRSWNTRRRA